MKNRQPALKASSSLKGSPMGGRHARMAIGRLQFERTAPTAFTLRLMKKLTKAHEFNSIR